MDRIAPVQGSMQIAAAHFAPFPDAILSRCFSTTYCIWNPEDASGGTVLDNLTRDRLEELESAPRTPMRLFCDYLICFLPVLAGCLALAEYLWVPNLKGNRSTPTYAYFLAVLIVASLAFFAAAFRSRRVFYRLRYKAPFYAFVFLLLAGYDILTLKRGTLMLPYFPWADEILNAAWQDRAYLLNCTCNSLFLLFSGYFVGAAVDRKSVV